MLKHSSSYYTMAGRILVLSMLLYTFAPVAISCGASLMALCSMSEGAPEENTSEATMSCCSVTGKVQGNTAGMQQIYDEPAADAACHKAGSEDTSDAVQHCSSCECTISSSKTIAAESQAPSVKPEGEQLVTILAAQQVALLVALITIAQPELDEPASLRAHIHEYKQRAQATPLRITHCSYLI